MLTWSCFIVSAYLIGSVPFGYLIARLFKRIDIREFGSHNIGATNVLRVVGPFPGLLTLAFDIGKGAVVVLLAKISFPSFAMLPIIVGICAVCGHNFSIFLKGRGGKGVATGFGVLVALAPIVSFLTFLVWLFILLISRYISLASLVGALAFPIFLWLKRAEFPLMTLGIFISILVVIRHRENIKRLIKGTEPKIRLPRPPKADSQ